MGVIKKQNSEAGFSLVELLVTVAILGLVLTIATTFLIDLIKTKAKTEMTREVQENGRYVVQRITREARWANEIVSASPSDITLGTSSGDVRFFLGAGGAGNQAVFIEHDGSTTQLTDDKITVSDLSFTTTTFPSVEFEITTQDNAGASGVQYNAETTLRSAASLRSNRKL